MPADWTLSELAGEYVKKSQEYVSAVGIEWERSGIYRDTFRPVAYTGDQGYLAVLERLVQEVGWEVKEEEPNVGMVELQRGITRVTIEGDGRLELSGSPQVSLHDLAREFRIHNNEVMEMGNVFNIGWLPLGLQPLHKNQEIELAPRERYRIFQKLGDPELKETMTKRTNGLTGNIGYKDEESAVRMAQTAFRVLPIVGAMFASSSLDAGAPAKYLDMRRYVLRRHIPGRIEVPTSILNPDFSLQQWIAETVKLPLLLTKVGDVTSEVTRPITFEQWMRDGIDGKFPTLEDFDVHVKTTWPDLRLRPAYLEYRVTDSVRLSLGMALPALMKGLLLDPANWDAVATMTEGWTYEDIIAADERAWKTGLKTKVQGKTFLTLAQDLVRLASDSLHSFKVMDGSGKDESVFLIPLKEYMHIKEKSPAEEILEQWEGAWSRNPANLLRWCEEGSNATPSA